MNRMEVFDTTGCSADEKVGWTDCVGLPVSVRCIY